MNNFVKIRIGYNNSMHGPFDSRNHAFEWVRNNYDPYCMVTVLSYERGQLEDLTRYHYNGKFFRKEDITY